MQYFIPILFLLVLLYFVVKLVGSKKWKKPSLGFPEKWRLILQNKISFYNSLSKEEKEIFEYEIQEFLLNHKITGIEVEVDLTDRILVAASAVIPIFSFPEWKYLNLQEVILYPSMFNENFDFTAADRNILGQVGSGYMEGKMILSKPALHQGFSNDMDKKNTAIHEFVHLIDKGDGIIDGIPSALISKQYAIPWIDLMHKKMDEIYADKSDINPYGGTNKAEFFAVASEYFFECPKLLSKKHPELYQQLSYVFKQEMKDKNLYQKKMEVGRNSPCPCGSGKKYKKCCGA